LLGDKGFILSNIKQNLGNWGENAVSRIFTSFGYATECRNYRQCDGEIDLICRDRNELVFIEVKTRKTRAFGSGEESITEQKELRLAAVASRYLQDRDLMSWPYRIDLVVLEECAPGFFHLRHHRGAIGDVHENVLDAP